MSDSEPPSPSGDEISWFRRLFGGGGSDSESALTDVLQQALDDGVIDRDAASMIEGVLDTAEAQVRDIMIPRGQMVVVEAEATLESVCDIVISSGHSRFPIIGESRDEVIGILLAKDLLSYIATGRHEREGFVASGSMRKPVFVPESKRLNVLLKEFRASRNHMAIVVDEYGGISGLVTIEDVLEQIVGEIDDEHDEAEGAFILRQDEQRFAVRALTPVEEFNRYFEAEFSEEEFDTVGGLVTNSFGRMPNRGESIHLDGFRFTVTSGDSRRLQQLQVALEETPSA